VLLTSAETASRLGVGVTAVKRWADEGVLPCVKTAGGHRRFRLPDVERLSRMRVTPTRGDEWSEWIDTLVNAGDVHLVLALLFAERARRGSWVEVATYLGALLETIGERWAGGELTVAQEHVASSLLQRALTLTVETMPVPASAPRCLLAPAEGEEHTLGLSLAELCLRENGWRAEWTGGFTRTVDVCERARSAGVRMVALSASSFLRNRRVLRVQMRAVGAACQRAGIALVLGGSGQWPEPPAFGVRLHRWPDFCALVRRQR
jgi:MerR family transcriptional regulator, light-induced transcriptional regulator